MIAAAEERRPQVLCADDEPITLEILRTLLATNGYEVLTAETGAEALALLESARPDLIVLDVMLPDMEGYQVCERIQAQETLSYVPVVFASSVRTEDADRARAFALGAVDFIVKPVDRTAFLATVAKHVATRQRWKGLGRRDDGGRLWTHAAGFGRFLDHLGTRLALSATQRSALGALRPSDLYAACDVVGFDETALAQHVAEAVRLPFQDTLDLARLALGPLPAPFCRHNLVVALEEGPGEYAFALSNPFDVGLQQTLRQWKGHGRELRLAVTPPSRIRELFERAVPAAAAATEAEVVAEDAPSDSPPEGAIVNEDSPPLVRLVNQIIEAAYDMGASDIHIEPAEEEIVVRYRIDGRLRRVNRFRGRTLARPMASRLKLMANLDIVERRLPQDGRIVFKRFSSRGADFDLRISTAPMQYGEKIVLRILDRRRALLPLAELGFSDRHLHQYLERIRAPHGMVLHVGPTGSGKSMTLYAALNEVKAGDVNVQTAEDPIEYVLAGINQLQVQPDIGLTFAQALRSFLRQDPDVVLVGEIRDRETASVALEAALTGHLLLSTLHTNDAASTVVRLLEMGIEPYLVSSSLLLVCAQRLLRRLCGACKEPYEPDESQAALIGVAPGTRLHRARGCPQCNQIGYRGRIGVHELLIPDQALRAAITTPGMTAERLKQLAVEQAGMCTLYWDAIQKVRAGICSLDDVLSEIRMDEFDSRPAWMAGDAAMHRHAHPMEAA
jgi:type IV pilus assembly protein PilB